MRKIIFIVPLFFVFSQLTFAQHRTCHKDLYMHNLQTNPVRQQQRIAMQQRVREMLENQNKLDGNETFSPNSTVFIPVAVHFPEVSLTSSVITCLQALAQSQIDVLNADYNATNSDVSLWSQNVRAFYPGTNIGNWNVRFVIATQNHPAGFGLVNGNRAITFGTSYLNGEDVDERWRGYLNIVCKDADGALGYSPLGGFPLVGEAVVIDTNAFGTGAGCTGYVPSSPFNKGRTLTHEVGHFFDLDHTFAGCSTGTTCSTAGDAVCDTPASNNESYGCPTAGSVTNCSVRTLTMNYMDYTNDACMYMFTAGQTSRMQAYYNIIASTFSTTTLSNTVFNTTTFNIYPNPSKGEFTIQTNDANEKYDVEVHDALGRKVFEQNINQNQNRTSSISLEKRGAGVYFVSIKSMDKIVTKKLIVQ